MDHIKKSTLLIISALLLLLGFVINEVSFIVSDVKTGLAVMVIATSTCLLATCYALLNFYSLKDNVYLHFVIFLTFSLAAVVGNHAELLGLQHSFNTLLVNTSSLNNSIALTGLLWLFFIYQHNIASTNKILISINDKKYKRLLIVSVIIIMLGLTSLYFYGHTQSIVIKFIDAAAAFICIGYIIILMIKHQNKPSIFLTLTVFTLVCSSVLNIITTAVSPILFNALTACFILQSLTLTMALATRLNQQAKQRINSLRYHQETELPSKVILSEKVSSLIESEQQTFSLIILQPENIHEFKKYVSEAQLLDLLNTLKTLITDKVDNSNAIISLTKQNEKVSFIEGNCFALLVNTTDIEKITTLITLLQKSLHKPIKVGGLTPTITTIFGVSQYPTHCNATAALVNCALIALKHARMTQKKWCLYQSPTASKNRISNEFSLAIALEHALNHDELKIFHQPQLDLKMQRVCGSECILHWQHTSKGLIDTQLIYSIAQSIGLMTQLTLWVVKKSLEQHKEICELGGYNHMVSINILPKDILNQGFIGKLIDVIEASEVAGEKIILELNRSAEIINNEDALSVMEQLSELGITVSVDDFYSGYTTLANYKTLPFQELKIEGQFIEGLSGTARQKSITETTIKMAKSLSLEVVAEGISSQWEQDILTKFGCDIGQGKFFSEALSKDAYINWLADQVNGKVSEDKYGEFIPAKKS